MSAFHPDSYAEAKATHKPLSRKTPLRTVRTTGNAIRLNGDGKLTRAGRAPQRALRKRKAKKLTDGQLKKKVWKQFSIYIRTRGADEDGLNKCTTCEVRKFWKDLHAGHFIRGRLNSNLFDERGCHPQCYSCNVGAQGNVVLYYKFMLATYGQEVIDELLEQNNKTRKWRPGELKQLLDKYRSLNAENPLVAALGETK